ncbi:ATP-dependent Clp protease ATP-binding subunit [Candidatus Parcubacteria bacterium]|nr:ATP-dependent Clp protease ATP-binding subunit [Candidatus Parcubacteria bacterium]
MEPLKRPKPNGELAHISARMKKSIIGQDSVVDKIVDAMGRFTAGMSNPEGPLLNMLFLGPTGVGKTETVRVLSDVLFGHRRAFTKVACEEYAAHYNISKLLGSPPGYVGGEIRPILAQENIDRHHLKARENQSGMVTRTGSRLADLFPPEAEKNLSLILFDEIEKGHPKLWNTLLGALEDGVLVLGNNEEVDFRNSIIICTSNIGSRALSERLSNSNIGFTTDSDSDKTASDIEATALREAKKHFPIEWLNRMNEIISFHPLDREQMFKIARILMHKVYGRCLMFKNCPFLLEATDEAMWHLVESGSDKVMGARPLRNFIEQEVVTPISHYINGEVIQKGDLVSLGVDDSGLVFTRVQGMSSQDDLDRMKSSLESRWLATDLGVKDSTGEKKKLPAKEEGGVIRAQEPD